MARARSTKGGKRKKQKGWQEEEVARMARGRSRNKEEVERMARGRSRKDGKRKNQEGWQEEEPGRMARGRSRKDGKRKK